MCLTLSNDGASLAVALTDLRTSVHKRPLPGSRNTRLSVRVDPLAAVQGRFAASDNRTYIQFSPNGIGALLAIPSIKRRCTLGPA